MRPDATGFLKLTSKGLMEDFAQDVPEAERQIMLATQGPTSVHALTGAVTVPAWKTRPSWYMVATNDRTIPPGLEAMMAKKINAVTVSLASSHVPMLSHPKEVAALVLRAAGHAAN